MDMGTDVNFGTLTRKMGRHLLEDSNVEVFLYHEVKDISPRKQDMGNESEKTESIAINRKW